MSNIMRIDDVGTAYAPGDKLPVSAMERISPMVLERFHRGKREVFTGVQRFFSDVYDHIMDMGSEIYIVDPDDKGELYYWAVAFEKKYIFSSIEKNLETSRLELVSEIIIIPCQIS